MDHVEAMFHDLPDAMLDDAILDDAFLHDTFLHPRPKARPDVELELSLHARPDVELELSLARQPDALSVNARAGSCAALSCPLCHTALRDGDVHVTCAICSARQHAACVHELGGCHGQPPRRPFGPPPPPPPWWTVGSNRRATPPPLEDDEPPTAPARRRRRARWRSAWAWIPPLLLPAAGAGLFSAALLMLGMFLSAATLSGLLTWLAWRETTTNPPLRAALTALACLATLGFLVGAACMVDTVL